MAERSKAPDSREILFASVKWAFWSSNEGVGSNPTSDTNFLSFLTLIEMILDHLVELICQMMKIQILKIHFYKNESNENI